MIPATQAAATVTPNLSLVPPTPATAPVPVPDARKQPPRERPTPADIAVQRELMKRHFDATMRNAKVSGKLDAQRRRDGADAPKLPPEITQSRTDLTAELSAAYTAIRTRDFDEARKQLQSAEDNLTTLETYVKP